jgi:enoyl-CoA hydratase/carnithine racemase
MSVAFEMSGNVAVLTLHEPERRNALSQAMVDGLLAGLAQARKGRARAIVIAGSGDAFCAGAHIRDLLNGGWMAGKAGLANPVDVFEQLTTGGLIAIAAVGGLALGGGFELALSCDLALASPDAVFGLPEVEHGVIPNTGIARLTRLIGTRRALELILTRQRIDAEAARAMGIVCDVVPGATLVDGAVKLAEKIVSAAPPGALAAVKAAMHEHHPTDWCAVRRSLAALPEAEWREGLGSYLERRAPDYERFWRSI